MTAFPAVGILRAATFGGALALVGCGGPSFERLPRPAVDLSGHWVYVAADSDNANALIAAALPKPRRPERFDRDATPLPGNDGSMGRQGGQRRGQQGEGSTGSVNSQPPVWGRTSPGDFVRAFVAPAQRLDIVSEPELLTLTQGERRRRFQPGDEEPFSVTDRFGSRTVRSGWDGAMFAIKSSSGNRLGVLETLKAISGDRLATTVEFSAAGMRSLKVHSVYRRASADELAAPLPEGPPVPGPR